MALYNNAMPVPLNRVCNFYYRFYNAMSCPEVPLLEKFIKDFNGGSFVDLLEGFSDIQNFYCFQVKLAKLNRFETLFLPFTKIITVFKENVFGVLQDWIFCHFRFSDFINSFVYHFCNLKSVKHNVGIRQVFFDT